jgi:hypothetical protein
VVSQARINRLDDDADRFEAACDTHWSPTDDAASLSQEDVDLIYC